MMPRKNEKPLDMRVGKIKHDRMVKITAMLIAFSGSVVAGLALSETTLFLSGLNKFVLLGFMILAILIYIFIQNANLNTLETLLGWDESREEGKMNPYAKEIDKQYRQIIAMITENR